MLRVCLSHNTRAIHFDRPACRRGWQSFWRFGVNWPLGSYLVGPVADESRQNFRHRTQCRNFRSVANRRVRRFSHHVGSLRQQCPNGDPCLSSRASDGIGLLGIRCNRDLGGRAAGERVGKAVIDITMMGLIGPNH